MYDLNESCSFMLCSVKVQENFSYLFLIIISVLCPYILVWILTLATCQTSAVWKLRVVCCHLTDWLQNNSFAFMILSGNFRCNAKGRSNTLMWTLLTFKTKQREKYVIQQSNMPDIRKLNEVSSQNDVKSPFDDELWPVLNDSLLWYRWRILHHCQNFQWQTE